MRLDYYTHHIHTGLVPSSLPSVKKPQVPVPPEEEDFKGTLMSILCTSRRAGVS